MAAAAGATPSFTDPGFESLPLASGLDLPTDVAWAPDGRMFIAEKEGYVRVVEPDGALLANPILDIHDHVIPYGDRGLIGIAVAPIEKSSNVTLYLLYDYDHDGAVGTSEETVATATLTSVTVEADNKVVGGKVVGGKEGVNPTETTIVGSVNSPGTTYGSACASESLDCIPSDGFTHSIGTVLYDPEEGGSLWVGSGDGLDDFGDEKDPGTTKALHIRAQNPESLAGKILHVHLNGEGFANSPFCSNPADTTSNCSKVYASGLRNPFRFTLRQIEVAGKQVSVPVIGDVGEGHWEEVDLADSRGFNGGWPCYEGNEANPDFTNTTQCEHPTTPFDAPLFVYTHYNDQCAPYPNPPNPCDTNNEPGAAVASAGIYTGKTYPASIQGKLFVADYVNGWISAVNLASPPEFGYSSGLGMPLLATGLGELVDTVQAPESSPAAGNLVYITLSVNSETALGFGTVQEIRYAPGKISPVAVPAAASSCLDSSTGPRQVSFIGDGSYDPEGDATLTYRWDFGDGQSSNQANPIHTYSVDGDYEARLTATDSDGDSGSGFLAVHVHTGQGGQPSGEIKFPEAGTEYVAGKAVELSGNDATAGAESQWQVVKYDGKNILGAMPPVETGTEGSTEFQTDSSPTSTTDYALHFSVSNGTCTTTKSRIMEPQRGQLTMSSQDQSGNPLPVPLTFAADEPQPSPLVLTVVKNMLAEVTAPQTFTSGESTYEFTGWSDGGAREHSTYLFEYPSHVAEETQSLTATYTKVVPPIEPPPIGPIVGPLPTEVVVHPTAPAPQQPTPAPAPRVSIEKVKGRPSSLQGSAADAAGMKTLSIALRPQHIKGRGCLWWSPGR